MSTLNKLFESFRNFINEDELIESRLSDTVAKYPDFKGYIEQYAKRDPSGKNKYLTWFAKQLNLKSSNVSGPETDSIANAIADTIEGFHKNLQRMPEKDINKYKTTADLKSAIESLGISGGEKKRKEKETAMEGSTIVFEDNDFFVVRPDTTESSCYYGKQTRWCIAATNSSNYFNYYTGQNKVFYMLRNENLQEDDDEKKIAFVIDYDNHEEIEEYYNALDDSIHRSKVIAAIARNLFGGIPADTEYEPSLDDRVAADEKLNKIEHLMSSHAEDNPPSLDGMKEKLNEIQKAFDDKAVHTSINWDWAEVDSGDIYFNGYGNIEFDPMKWVNDPEEQEKKIIKLVYNTFTENNVYPDHYGIEIEWFDEGSFRVAVSFDPENHSGVDGFSDFADEILAYDKQFDEIKSDIIIALEEKAFIKGGAYTELLNMLKTSPDFKHLNIEIDGSDITVSVPLEVNIHPDVMHKKYDIINFIRSIEMTELYRSKVKKIVAQADEYAKKQLELFERLIPKNIPIGRIVYVDPGENWTGALESSHIEATYDIAITRTSTEKRIKYIYDFVKFLDKHYDILSDAFNKSLQDVIRLDLLNLRR